MYGNNYQCVKMKGCCHQSKHLSILVWIGQQLASGVFVWETFQLWYVYIHTRVCVCVCFVCAQVSCALTEVSFPSIFEESVLASFSLEATLHGGASDSDFHFEVEGFRAPCISAA